MKVLITHEGQQSVFKRIQAMKNNGIDVVYATSFYYKKNIFNNLLKRILSSSEQKRLEDRRCSAIEDNNVYIFSRILGLIFIIINRLDKTRVYRNKILKYLVNNFSKNIIKLISEEKFDMIILLGESADKISELLYNRGYSVPVIKDTTSANLEFCYNIYRNDVNNSGIFGRDMNNIFLQNKKNKISYINKAHYFKVIVSSGFVANSYRKQLNSNDIKIVTYGMDVSNFTEKIENFNCRRKLKILYVGNIDERKGIYYINELAKISKNIAEFTLIGDATLSEEALEELKKNVFVHRRVNHSELPEIYKKHDIFIFPSLSDSFGNVISEAMASGLPVICSKNAGASDLIKEGINGFIVDYNDVDRMKVILVNLYKNPEKIRKIGHEARITAINNNPSYYEKSYVKVVNEIMREWNENK